MTTMNGKSAIWLALAISAAALAAGGPPADKPGGRPGGETAGNNLSFPVIFSDGATPTGEYTDLAAWTFYSGPWSDANGDGIYDQCTSGVPDGTAVPDQYICFQKADDPDLKVWWLQERNVNRWQVFDPRNAEGGASGTIDFGDIVVSALDWGDLLESSTVIGAKKVRTEVSLLQDAHSSGATFVSYLAEPVAGSDEVVECSGGGTDCFAAIRMSGAVPGTEQSINEVQGSDFGASEGNVLGSLELIDPASVRFETDPATGYEATLYSACARLLIQPLIEGGEDPAWSDDAGVWLNAGDPVINIRAFDGGYSAEINAGGTMLYGYNWTTKGLTPGKYRLTFVLDGPGSGDYACSPLKTYFGPDTRVFVTPAEPEGEITIEAEGSSNPAYIVPSCSAFGEGEGESIDCVDRGGLSYIDVTLGKTTGGGGGGKPPRP